MSLDLCLTPVRSDPLRRADPLRAGLVESAADWPWSTYGQILGTVERWPFFDPARVTSLFGSRSTLRTYVESERTIKT